MEAGGDELVPLAAPAVEVSGEYVPGVVKLPEAPPMIELLAPPEVPPAEPTGVVVSVGMLAPVRLAPGKAGVVEPPAPPPMTGVEAPPGAPPAELWPDPLPPAYPPAAPPEELDRIVSWDTTTYVVVCSMTWVVAVDQVVDQEEA